DRMFRSGLPRGWTEWGFKEILYGLDNNAPASLLRLYPAATAAFTFREPKTTIESMIRTWSPELLRGPPVFDELSKLYKMRSRRWKLIVEYFLNLRHSDIKIIFISSDKLNLPVETILHALGLSRTRSILESLHVTNRGLNNWPQWADDTLNDLFAHDKCE